MTTEPVDVATLRERFRLRTNRGAAALMRKMRHVTTAGRMFTTEAWLAEWMAAEAVPAMNWPPKNVVYDPVEEAINSRVVAVIGRLSEQGVIRVNLG